MRINKQDTEILSELYNKVTTKRETPSQLNEAAPFSDHLKPQKGLKTFLNAQTEGQPLVNADGSQVAGTVYLGQGSYIWNHDGGIYIANAGRTRINADGSMPWENYMDYDPKVFVNADVLKKAAAYIDRL
jgi:hypothetical protein